MLSSAEIVHEPLGLVLIISSWNLPFGELFKYYNRLIVIALNHNHIHLITRKSWNNDKILETKIANLFPIPSISVRDAKFTDRIYFFRL